MKITHSSNLTKYIQDYICILKNHFISPWIMYKWLVVLNVNTTNQISLFILNDISVKNIKLFCCFGIFILKQWKSKQSQLFSMAHPKGTYSCFRQNKLMKATNWICLTRWSAPIFISICIFRGMKTSILFKKGTLIFSWIHHNSYNYDPQLYIWYIKTKVDAYFPSLLKCERWCYGQRIYDQW